MSGAAPPYRAATAVTAIVLLGYVLTLAPTVTFWDAGEFIAAARTLGIPHPPGTPLFVLIAHVWALIFPFGEYAVRTNLLSAILSAAGAGCFFLVAHESLRLPSLSPPARMGCAAAGAVIGAFTFTAWQNSNETEVYAVATFTIGAMAWLICRWRRCRETPDGERTLLLVIYLAGVSIGNHLLALLAGPAIVAFLAATLHESPHAEAAVRRREWAQVAVVAGVWMLLVGTGLGSTTLVVLGATACVAAGLFSVSAGAGTFAAASLALAVVGVTPYLFLYLRSAQHPMINEAAPATFDALLAVIRRAQYPPRTPFDDPTVSSGFGNPGRSLRLVGIQLLDYLVYFDWQWARSIGREVAGFPLRTLVTLGFASLGLRGLAAQRRTDRAAWWLLLTLFLVTGLGLVGYMNFRPGLGRWYDVYPSHAAHEVRERDYFFVVSFIVWGLWAGMGLAELITRAAASRWRPIRAFAPALLLLAGVPMVLNWQAATRRGTADARLAEDFAYDLLNSAPPYGILFTYGDNDTFPLWWAQEVAGIRRDVTVVCLALANTEWYMRQLRDAPTRPLDLGSLPPVWRSRVGARPAWPLHGMTDSMIRVASRGYRIRGTQRLELGPITRTLHDGTLLLPSDLVAMSIVRQNIGRRPLVWAATTGKSIGGLTEFAVQRGMGFEVLASRPDTGSTDLAPDLSGGVPLDVPTTEALVWDTYRYAGLLDQTNSTLETTSAQAASSLAPPFVRLVSVYAGRGDRRQMERAADAAARLSSNPRLRTTLLSTLTGGDSVPAGRSAP